MAEILTFLSALVGGPVAAFFGGGAFRLIWGELSSWWTKKQDHAQEIERMELQGKLDAAQHERNLAAQRLQADLGVKVIEAQREAAVGQIEAGGWLEAIKATTVRVGVAWIDGWNAIMRPAIATWGVVMLTIQEGARLFGSAFVLSDITLNVACGAIGIFIAARDLQKRGK
jgi:hypothetical protein